MKANGRPDGVEERSDCVIRACVLAMGIPYNEAWLIAKRHGRKDRGRCMNGATAFVMDSCADASGSVVKYVYNKPKRVGQVLANCTQGSYIVRVRNHVFSLIDGVCMDGEEKHPRVHVIELWRVTKT